MNDLSLSIHPLFFAAGGLLIGVIIGYLLGLISSYKLKHQLDKQQALEQEKLNQLQAANANLKEHFAHLSQEALKNNRESFIELAEQQLKHQQQLAQAESEKREQSLNGLIRPIKEALGKTEKQMQEMEKERINAYGSLGQQIQQLAHTQSTLQTETRNLVTALRRPEVRGQWGEITLKRLAELAGMVEYCDFTEQTSVTSESGIQRPDMIVRMPDQRELIIDAKTPLDAYLRAIQCESDTERKNALLDHAKIVRQRVRELAQKKYWDQFDQSPDYVVLFIPGDQFLSSALEVDSEIMEYSLSNQVILATPTSLIALLRAVAFGWRQQAVAENAEKIQKLGEELHGRIATFTEHLSKLGNHINKSVEFYNKSLGSLERNVIPGARKFIELGIEEKKKLTDSTEIEKVAKSDGD